MLVSDKPAACPINVGEALYRQMRTVGAASARSGVNDLRGDLHAVEVDWPLVEAAAKVKAEGGMSYADAFCVATAQRLGAELWTGDPEIVEAAGRLGYEVRDLRGTA